MSETLLDSRCPVCGWTGTTDDTQCPDCGHGLLNYEVILDE